MCHSEDTVATRDEKNQVGERDAGREGGRLEGERFVRVIVSNLSYILLFFYPWCECMSLHVVYRHQWLPGTQSQTTIRKLSAIEA